MYETASIFTYYFKPYFKQYPLQFSRENSSKLLDAFILAYDAMYIDAKAYETDYIILNMESFYFIDTTHEDREKYIYFNFILVIFFKYLFKVYKIISIFIDNK